MKHMKKGDDVIKVAEKEVDKKLEQGWNYCPRSEWVKVRDANKPTSVEKEEEKKEKKNYQKSKKS